MANKILSKLRNTEPALTNADQLTDSIMKAIASDASRPKGRGVSMVYRMLLAASVALLLLFCIEEYIFLDKIKALESETAEMTKFSELNPSFGSLVTFDAGLQRKIIIDMISNEFNDAGKAPLARKIQIARFNALDIRLLQLTGNLKVRDVRSIRRPGFFNN